MNIHPIFVHFPIALLTVYAALELARFKQITSRDYVFYVKAALLFFGIAGAVAAYLTGNSLGQLYASDPTLNHLVQTHSHWAIATICIFGFLAACYLISFIVRELPHLSHRPHIKNAHDIASRLIASSVVPIIALVGLVCVTVTGALGGAIVYGVNIDPVVHFITKLVT